MVEQRVLKPLITIVISALNHLIIMSIMMNKVIMHFCTTLKCHYYCCWGDWTFFELGKNACCFKSLIIIGEYLFLNQI